MNEQHYIGKNNEKPEKQYRHKTCKQRKILFKTNIKPRYLSQKIFDNNLVATCKSKVTLTLNKPAYTRLCISDLSKVLIYELIYDYITNNSSATKKYYLQRLIT